MQSQQSVKTFKPISQFLHSNIALRIKVVGTCRYIVLSLKQRLSIMYVMRFSKSTLSKDCMHIRHPGPFSNPFKSLKYYLKF